MSESDKTVRFKVDIHKLKAFFIPTMKYEEQKLGENPMYYSKKKNKILRSKLNQGGKRPTEY